MELSRLKWPIIIVVVVGIGWLLTSPGVDYMHRKFTQDPGDDAQKAKAYDAGLSRLGGYLMMTFQFGKAETVLHDALLLYGPNGQFGVGENHYFNYYRLATVKEHLNKIRESVDILGDLMDVNARQYDVRVPEIDVLNLRRNKLIEMHELGEMRGPRPGTRY